MVLADVGVCQDKVKRWWPGEDAVSSPRLRPTSLSPVDGSRSPNWNGVGAGVGVSVGSEVGATEGGALGSGVAVAVGDGLGVSVGDAAGGELLGAVEGVAESETGALVGPGIGVGLELVQLASTIASIAVIAANLRAWEGLIERVFTERLATPTSARQRRAYR